MCLAAAVWTGTGTLGLLAAALRCLFSVNLQRRDRWLERPSRNGRLTAPSVYLHLEMDQGLHSLLMKVSLKVLPRM